MKRWLAFAAVIAIAVGAVNFFWFMAEASALGGDALNGYAQNGHFFVGSHGDYREVGRDTWEWSRAHSISLFFTHPLAILGIAFLLFNYVFPWSMGTRGSTDARVAEVQSSGERLAFTRTGGIVGEVHMTSPLLAIAVYPGGVVLKPMLTRPIVLRAEEITGVNPRRILLASRLEIEHTSDSGPSPITVYLRADSVVGRALVAVADRGGTRTRSVIPARTMDPARAKMRTANAVLGTVMGTAFVVMGIVEVIPAAGPFGILWTGFSAVIAVMSARQLIRR